MPQILIIATFVVGIVIVALVVSVIRREKKTEKKNEVDPEVLCRQTCCCQTRQAVEQNGHGGGSH